LTITQFPHQQVIKPNCARVTGMSVRKILESLCESYWNKCAKDAGIVKIQRSHL